MFYTLGFVQKNVKVINYSISFLENDWKSYSIRHNKLVHMTASWAVETRVAVGCVYDWFNTFFKNQS